MEEIKDAAKPKRKPVKSDAPKVEYVDPGAPTAERLAVLLGRRGYASDSLVYSIGLYLTKLEYLDEATSEPDEAFRYALQKAAKSSGYNGLVDGYVTEEWWQAFKESVER